LRCNRWMTENDVIIGTFFATGRVQPDFEQQACFSTFVIWQPLAVCSHMATKTAFGGLGMTDLTGDLAAVGGMNPVGFLLGRFGVTGLTGRPFRKVEPGCCRPGRRMHLIGRVTIHTGHVSIRIVHIRFVVADRTGKFTMDAPAMTARAGGVHGRGLDEPVGGQKTALGIFRPAYMALPAAGMTDEAVLVQGHPDHSQAVRVFSTDALRDGRFHRVEGDVQAGCSRSHNLIMAFAAGCRRVRIGRVPNHVIVDGLPVFVVGVAAVAVLAGNLAVVGIQKCRLYVNFLVQLQRSQRAASPFPAGLTGLDGLRSGGFDLPAESDQLFQVGVAGDATADIVVFGCE